MNRKLMLAISVLAAVVVGLSLVFFHFVILAFVLVPTSLLGVCFAMGWFTRGSQSPNVADLVDSSAEELEQTKLAVQQLNRRALRRRSDILDVVADHNLGAICRHVTELLDLVSTSPPPSRALDTMLVVKHTLETLVDVVDQYVTLQDHRAGVPDAQAKLDRSREAFAATDKFMQNTVATVAGGGSVDLNAQLSLLEASKYS